MVTDTVSRWHFELFTLFKEDQIKAWAKYGHLKLPGAFYDNVTPDIDFTDDAVIQCDVPVVQILL